MRRSVRRWMMPGLRSRWRISPGAVRSLATLLLVPLAVGCSPDVPAEQLALGEAVVERAARPPLDTALLDAVYARAAQLPRLRSLLVAEHGELLREEYFNDASANRAANIKSASKSIISALVGIAIAEGKLEGLDQPIAPFFPEYAAAHGDPRMQEVTIGHLLSMQAGLEPTSFGNYGEWVSSRNWVRYVLTRPFADDPGGSMQYSTGSTHLLSAILTKATGMSTLAYAREKLGRPLGIDIPGWTRDPQGVYFGGNKMHLRPRDLLAFAELYRNGGRHEGVQIVPEAWVRDSWIPRTQSRFNSHRYGLGWWIRRSGEYDVYFAWGYGGQYAFIIPALGLTVVTTSDAVSAREGSHNRELHRLVDVLTGTAGAAAEWPSAGIEMGRAGRDGRQAPASR